MRSDIVPGAAFPDYELSDHTAKRRKLSELQGQDPWFSSLAAAVTARKTAGRLKGYTGREFDADTGLYYFRARWYDPQVGRFISEDPIGFLGRDVNFYAYVRNNPIELIDPSGLRRCNPIIGAIAGGLIGGGAGTVVGGGLGALAGAVFGGVVGTPAGPPGEVIVGGGGALVGAGAGTFAGSAIGIGVGIGVGIDYCKRDDATTCDKSPRAVPMPTNQSTPLLPPPPQHPDDLCDEPWRAAFARCEREMRSGNRGVTGGHTDLYKCARGLVSQRC